MKQLSAQRDESDTLRKQVEAASQAAVQSNTIIAAQIQEAIDEERRLAAEDRQQLLAQIGNLITAQANTQESRFAAKTDAIRERIAESNTTFGDGLEAYAKGMDTWNTNADSVVQDAGKSRDALKLRLQEDWTVSYI